MADPILNSLSAFGPGETQSPEQLSTYIPADVMPTVDFSQHGNSVGRNGEPDFGAIMSKAMHSATVNREQYQAFTPTAFNSKESGFDPIYNSFKGGLFGKLGFIYGQDNEDQYARELGRSGQMWQALKGILPLARLAHNEAWDSEADMWSGIMTGDLKKAFSLTMDKEDLLKLNNAMTDVNNSNFVPLTQEQRDGTFNMGKFARGFQQFGFTLGTTAQFLEQSALEWGATALTAPGTYGGSIVAEIANMTRRAFKAGSTINKLYDVSNAFQKVMKFENALMDTNKIGKAFNYLNTARKNSPIGSFGNFYRFTKEYNFAASEARFERAQSYADYVENKEREFYQQNGRPMDDQERQLAEEQGMEISNANGVTNIALLFAMNRLNMGNVMRTGFGMSKVIAAETGTIADDILLNTGKGNTNVFSKYFKKKAAKESADKAVATAADSAGPFIKASDVKMFSPLWFAGKGNKSFRWGVDSAFEGIQEVAQSVSGQYWKEYYTEKYTLAEEARNDWSHLMGVGSRAIRKAGAAQFSQEGLDTFISGFIIGVPSVVMNRGIGAVQRKMNGKAYAEKEQRLQQTVDYLNNWSKSPLQVFDRKLETYVNQTEISAAMQKAVKDNNIYAFKNLQRKAFQEFVMAGHKSGKLDAMLDMMDNAAKDLTDEQFMETFGIQSDSVSRKNAGDYVGSLRTKAKEFVKTYDDAVRKMPNPVNYRQYKEGTPERTQAEMQYKSWDKALEEYVFQRDANKDVVGRYKDILSKNQENLGTQAYEAFYKMTNVEFVNVEMDRLDAEIGGMEVQGVDLTKEQREILKDKKKEKDLLTKWKAELGTKVAAGEISAPGTPSAVFTAYLNQFQKKNNMPDLEADKVRAAFNDLSDLFRLDQDQKKTITNLNYLADPENFSKLYQEHMFYMGDIYQEIIKQRDEMAEKRSRVAELAQNDVDFRAKHYKLIEELEKAILENNADIVNGILDQLYEAEFGEPVVGKDESEVSVSSNIETRKQQVDEIAKLPFKERIPALIKAGIIASDVTYNLGKRYPVIMNIAGVKVAFYRSSEGTGGKQKGAWTPMFGFGENKGQPWLIKGDITTQVNVNYNSKAIQEYADILNKTLSWDHKLDEGQVKNHPYFNVLKLAENEQAFNKELYGVEDLKIVNGQPGVLAFIESKVSEINKAYEAELAAATSDPVVTPDPTADPVNSGSKPVAYNNIKQGIDKLGDTSVNADIDKIKDAINAAADADSISVDEEDELFEALSQKIAEIKSKKGQANTALSDTDPEFRKEYNRIMDDIQAVVEKPGVTAAEVKAAFRSMGPLMAKLDVATRAKYRTQVTQQQNEIIETINRNNDAKNIDKVKEMVSAYMANNDIPLTETVENLYTLLDIQVDPQFKPEILAHFETEFKKAVDARISKLKTLINTGAPSPVLEKLQALNAKYNNDVAKTLELFKKKSEELADKKGDISFTTEANDNFETFIHKTLVNITARPTAGQLAAINNLITSGVVSALDVESMDKGSLAGASEIINLGVNRIYALQINKAVNAFVANNKSTDLKDIYKAYLVAQGVSSKDAASIIEADIADFIKEKYDVEEILSSLDINQTPDITDAQYKLLNDYRNAVSNVITDTNIIASLSKLTEKQESLVSQEIPSDIDKIFDAKIMSVFKSFLIKDSSKNVNMDGFVADMKALYEKLKSETDPLAGLKEITKLASDHINSYKASDGKSMIQAYMAYALQTDALLSSGENGSSAPLSEQEMVAVLDKPNRSLGKQQIQQVETFGKGEYLQDMSKRLNAANGYVPREIKSDPKRLDIPLEIGKLSFISLRPKIDEDNRTTADLMTYLGVGANNTVPTRAVLQKIIDSKFATDTEKILAGQLLNAVSEADIITIDNTSKNFGEFDPETGAVTINLDALGYKKDEPSAAFETVVLHEMIHALTEKAIEDPRTEFGRAIRSVFNAVKSKPGADSFYAFKKDLSEDEQLREFVTEAMTSPAFQYMLSKIPYANSKKSTWEEFMNIIRRILEAVGIKADETALSEVISLTSELITSNTTNQVIEESKLLKQEKYLEKLRSIETVEDVASLIDDLQKDAKLFTSSVYKSIESSIIAKYNSIVARVSKEVLKDATKITVGNKTYYYKVNNGKLEVYRKGKNIAQRIRKEETMTAIVNKIMESKNIVDLMDPKDVNWIRGLGGKVQTRGSYASGQMTDETFAETKYANAQEVSISFRFGTEQEFRSFVSKFWKWKRGSYDKGDLLHEFGPTNFKNYVELTEKFTQPEINILIKKKRIKPVGNKGPFLEEVLKDEDNPVSEDELMGMFRFIVEGGNINDSEKLDIQKDINRLLTAYLGFKPGMQLQNKIEDLIFADTKKTDKDVDVDDVVLDGELLITTDKSTEDYVEDYSRLSYMNLDETKDRSAVNEYALRSHSWDIKYVDNMPVESEQFKKYYYKVRNIINQLSVQPIEDFEDVRVTIHADSDLLRWDGSTEDEGYQSSKKTVVGFLSDREGNPIIFNQQGQRVGTLDLNNLTDRKDLDNGDNQIVYFQVPATNKDKRFLDGAFDLMQKARTAAMEGRPQIAKLKRFVGGVANFKDQANPSTVTSKNTAKNPEFKADILKNGHTLEISGKGHLNVVVKAADGSVHTRGLYPSDTRKVSVTTRVGSFGLTDYVVELMKTYLEMNVQGRNIPGNVHPELVNFIRNIWFTGDLAKLKIPEHFYTVTISIPDAEKYADIKKTAADPDSVRMPYKKVTLSLFNVDQVGQTVTVNEQNLKTIRNYINNMPVNVYKGWLQQKELFKFPVLVEQNGEKMIKFVEKDYQNFLTDEVGLKGYFLEIPDTADIKRYNSIVEFNTPTDLTPKAPAPVVDQQEIIQDPQAIAKKVAEDIKNATGSSKVKNVTKRFFKAPKFELIYEKTCN